MGVVLRVYRLLLKCYPARFREEYGAPLEQQFLDELREADGHHIRFCLRLLFDLARSMPVELAREFRQDASHGLLVYASRPLVTVLALAALTLAIGATTGVFSVVNALLLRSLPFRDAERLVRLEPYPPVGSIDSAGFHQWRKASQYLQDAAAYTSTEMTVSRATGADRARVTETSSNFFALFGAAPQAGRTFAADEDVNGGGSVAVISDALWTQMFGRDPRAIGSTVRINGSPMSVIGVAPALFDYPQRTAVWTPTTFDFDRIPKRDMTYRVTVGRLKPGLTFTQAAAAFEAEVRRTQPDRFRANAALARAGFFSRPRLVAVRDELAGPVRQASLALMGAVLFVLLIACANVANLLLTRVVDRRHELAVRAALGASRARLVQQLLTEAMLLSLVGATGGLAVAGWTARLVGLAQPSQLAAQDYTLLDWRVLAFALLTACVTTLVFGVVPAWTTGRLQPVHLATRAGTDGVGRPASFRGALIAVQVALTLVLVSGAFAMTRGFASLMGTDLGYRTRGVATAKVSLAGTRYDSDAGDREYLREALARLRALPGVRSAAAINNLPLATSGFSGGVFSVDGGRPVMAIVVAATPDYFRTMSTPVLSGREFVNEDAAGAADVAIVNEEFAKLAGIGTQVVGKALRSEGKFARVRSRTIVGVAATTLYEVKEASAPRLAQIFVPFEQSPVGSVTFVIRAAPGTADAVGRCRDVLRGVDRQVPVFDVKTLDDRVAESVTRPRFYTTVVVFFGAFALLLAVVGVYGVASYSVTRRTHEIGVRLALGSSPSRVRRLLTREVALPLSAGIVAGIAGAAATARAVSHFMPGGRIDWAMCTLATVLVAGAALAAVWTATRRVGTLEPLSVLRAE